MRTNKSVKPPFQSQREHQCLRCFLNTEKVLESNWENLPHPARCWYELFDAENKTIIDYINRLDTKRILEMGCGPGRMINQIVRSGFKYDEIVGVDGDDGMVKVAGERFKDIPNINVKRVYVEDKLDFPDDYFDFCINAMNIVGWQEDEEKWLREMLRCSKVVFFSVYKKGDKELNLRREMYKTRGHGEVELTEKNQVVLECSVGPKKVVSKSYSYQELEYLCQKVAKDYKILELTPLMYGCLLSKEKL